MRYLVNLPEPTSKRMSHNRLLRVTIQSGWGGCDVKTYPLGDAMTIEIEVPDDAQPFDTATCLDGLTFLSEAMYYNSNGSRVETHVLRPVPVAVKA